ENNERQLGEYLQLTSIASELMVIQSSLVQSGVAGEEYAQRLRRVVPNNLQEIAAVAQAAGWHGLANLVRESREVLLEWSERADLPGGLHLDSSLGNQALLSIGRAVDEARRLDLELTQGVLLGQQSSARTYDRTVTWFSALMILSLGLVYLLLVRPLSVMRQSVERGLPVAHDRLMRFAAPEIRELAVAYDDGRRSQMESEGRIRAVFNQAGVGVLRVAPDGRFLELNQRYCKMVGYTEAELLKMTYQEITWPEDQAGDLERIRRLDAGEFRTFSKDKRYIRKDGSLIWGNVAVSVVRDEEGAVAYRIVIVQDISERKRAEQALRASYGELEQRVAERTAELSAANERLQELDRLKSMFIASMSHELRTPLNSIIGFTGLMLMQFDGPLTDAQANYMRRVQGSGKHLLHLISDIIDVARIEAGKLSAHVETTDVSGLVEEAIATVKPEADVKNLVISQVGDEWVEVETDRKRLMQCVLNYLSNAVKYTASGDIKVDVCSLDKQVRIAVTDTGPGIAKAHIPLLFKQFSRIESSETRKVSGTGLGLYLTRKIATEVLGGRVGVDSKLGHGSTFWLEIPNETPADH
ncbi:MAG TPA: PAS domain S-box protein, partial [Xanthomonadales bacterium]|nr:PAS domain S-box protein [Xanthomonadales bacterium]